MSYSPSLSYSLSLLNINIYTVNPPFNAGVTFQTAGKVKGENPQNRTTLFKYILGMFL